MVDVHQAKGWKVKAFENVQKYLLLLPIVLIIGLIVIVTAQAQSNTPYRFPLAAPSDTIARCLPTTPFDGDGQAGGTVLSSKDFLPQAPLP